MKASRFLALAFLSIGMTANAGRDYQEIVREDRPVAYWRFDDMLDCCARNAIEGGPMAKLGESVSLIEPGPRRPEIPTFPPENLAADFTQDAKEPYLRVPDPGDHSVLDFRNGDSITLEAWVQVERLKEGANMYIVGKGRTGNPRVDPNNQNWALRLRVSGGVACVNFLFRDRHNAGEDSWHRWTTTQGFAAGDAWHHVAITYTFGKPEAIKGYINGVAIEGQWDMGGPSGVEPMVDNDEVWIGSAIRGQADLTFPGRIDEVAIYRHALTAERIKLHATRSGEAPPLKEAKAVASAKKAPPAPPAPPPVIALDEVPAGQVRVEILEFPMKADALPAQTFDNSAGSPAEDEGRQPSWSELPTAITDRFSQEVFAATELPARYTKSGVRTDRSQPYLARFIGRVELPSGDHRLHLRALTGIRVSIDGKLLMETPAKRPRYGDAEPVPDQAKLQLVPAMPLLPPGHVERQTVFSSDGKPHVLVVEALIGGKNMRPELGELCLAIQSPGESAYLILAPSGAKTAGRFDFATWSAFKSAHRERIVALDWDRRQNPEELAYWRIRHELARKHAPPAPIIPAPLPGYPADHPIDRFLAPHLAKSNATLPPVIDDAAFLRRVALDTIGLIPTPREVRDFLADSRPDKRARAIDRLLADRRWADHWTSYWQDVLAENPNMLKGTLNNTGPFRWWLHEALSDNLPLDRFVTQLILMEGSANYGGPAGFALATQNDLPMAAKAQIISGAFLANEMKCARCHDAPSHPFDQRELFSMAAMLSCAPLKVPESSLTKGLSPDSHVTVSLKAGERIDPHFPFATAGEPLPGVLRRAGDPRERLAALLTDPRNDRLAQVVANRMWARYFGFGIVDPVDDWSDTTASHPELLRWLAHELVTHDYDLKHLARLIFNSHAYQRTSTAESSRAVRSSERTFAAPARRRLSAEQLVDSLFIAAGKTFASEPLTFDPEVRQSSRDQGNLGVPTRAWEFASLSNERDRPALAKPGASVVTDILATFGWRESRAEPRSARDHDPNTLQPAMLGNTTFAARIARLSDDSAFTALALRDQPLADLIRETFQRILSRNPTDAELQRFTELLAPGYDGRKTGAEPLPPQPLTTKGVSWANHLHPDASTAILELEKEVKRGDPPTPQITAHWRERMEDMIWILMLSPEFMYVP